MKALAVSLSLHEVRAPDLDAIAELELRTFPVPWKRDYFAADVGVSNRFNRVARDPHGRLAGYLFCTYAAGEIHINKIAVAEPFRRRGVALRLMDEVFSVARRLSSQEIFLEVRPSNVAARAFYRTLGFVETGSRTAYYLDGEDAILMSLKLSP